MGNTDIYIIRQSIINDKNLKIIRLKDAITELVNIKDQEQRELFAKNIFNNELSIISKKSISDIGLSILLCDKLKSHKDSLTVGDIMKLGSHNLLAIPGIGQSSLRELREKFKELGLTLE